MLPLAGKYPGCASRSEVNAIQVESGDQLGRKFPDECFVRLEYVFELMSISQMPAVPPLRVDTNASVFPSGDRAA